MSGHDEFAFVRSMDRTAFDAHDAAGERFSQKLLDRSSGGNTCAVSLISTPPGGGSPEGLHVHDFDQVFYVLEGSMYVEVGGEVFVADAGCLVVFPKAVPHRNWNDGPAVTRHLAINVPAPELGVPAARPFPQALES